jgi:hypothetical protein
MTPVKSILRKIAALFILTGMLLSACDNNLWGSYNQNLTPSAVSTATVAETPTPTYPIPPDSTLDPTASPSPTPTNTPVPTNTLNIPASSILYFSQSGDSLDAVAIHFGVMSAEISSPVAVSATGFLDPGTPLFIPNRLLQTQLSPSAHLLPDSELVYSPTANDFNIQDYVNKSGGKLATFREYLAVTAWTTGAGVVQRMAFEGSINPRLLLALIQYYSSWVMGTPKPGVTDVAPLGYRDDMYSGLYQQLRLAVQDLAAGYYGWRGGTLTYLKFPDGTSLRLAPDLNAGTVALQYLFSKRVNHDQWLQIMDPNTGFMALYTSMFGDPFARARLIEPLFPPGMNQPNFTLPFESGVLWSFTGGPHSAWEQESVLAAVDFAPASAEPGCLVSDAWEVAIAPGRVVRSGGGYVVIDLDGDGFEQTGWDVLYMHVATRDRIAAGTWVNAGDRIGHPSCEGGIATGTHLHIARKYNGEWVGAGGPLPFVMSGWTVHYGIAPYMGTLTKGDLTTTANQFSIHESQITRGPGE